MLNIGYYSFVQLLFFCFSKITCLVKLIKTFLNVFQLINLGWKNRKLWRKNLPNLVSIYLMTPPSCDFLSKWLFLYMYIMMVYVSFYVEWHIWLHRDLIKCLWVEGLNPALVSHFVLLWRTVEDSRKKKVVKYHWTCKI